MPCAQGIRPCAESYSTHSTEHTLTVSPSVTAHSACTARSPHVQAQAMDTSDATNTRKLILHRAPQQAQHSTPIDCFATSHSLLSRHRALTTYPRPGRRCGSTPRAPCTLGSRPCAATDCTPSSFGCSQSQLREAETSGFEMSGCTDYNLGVAGFRKRVYTLKLWQQPKPTTQN